LLVGSSNGGSMRWLFNLNIDAHGVAGKYVTSRVAMPQRPNEADGPAKRRGGRGSGGYAGGYGGGGAVEALLKTSSSEQGSAHSGDLVSRDVDPTRILVTGRASALTAIS
jgi:hypothetical protein